MPVAGLLPRRRRVDGSGAVVVDPRRDVGEYLADAAEAGLSIELVVETHFHADFLSGHLEMAAATGADIGYSSVASPEFDFRPLGDGERMVLGEVVLEFRHTPGHTPESLSVVVWEHADDAEPYAVLTGDTLFIGDVGRPDLLVSFGHSRDELASCLYDSLHERLMTLPDATRVFPGHGAGSACGKNLSTDTSSTIGEQRRSNYAVKAPDRDTFIGLITEGQPTAPAYFPYDAVLNQSDHGLLDEEQLPTGPSLDEVDAATAAGAVLVDVRDPEDFARGHLVVAINVGLNGRYAEFAGSVVPVDVDIVLFADPGTELEAKNRLARIGFDRDSVDSSGRAPTGVSRSSSTSGSYPSDTAESSYRRSHRSRRTPACSRTYRPKSNAGWTGRWRSSRSTGRWTSRPPSRAAKHSAGAGWSHRQTDPHGSRASRSAT